MLKYFLAVLLLISPSLPALQSLKKYNGFDKLNDNICAYYNSYLVGYVKMCDEGKYCKAIGSNDAIYMCVDIEKEIKKKYLDEACTQSDLFDECGDGLVCSTNNKCSRRSSCTGATTIYKTETGSYACKPNDMPSGLYYYVEYDNSYIPSKTISTSGCDYGKVGGIISFIHDNSNNYYITKKENAYLGTVKNGEFVENSLACESGFALEFFPDGGLKDPSSSNSNTPFKKCVTVNSIDVYDSRNGDCAINYDDDKIYYIQSNTNLCNEFLMTKLKLFKKYIEKFTPEKQESCSSNKDNYNERWTCNDDEIRKWYYFYDNPEHYLLYYEKNEKPNDVVNFLIQQKYKLYQSSGFISIRYLLLLFLIFFI